MIEFKRVFDSVFVKEAGVEKLIAGTTKALDKATAAATAGISPAYTKALQDPNIVSLQKRLSGAQARQAARVKAKPMIPVNAQTAKGHLAENPVLRNKNLQSEEALAYKDRARQQLQEKLYYQGREAATAEPALTPLQQKLRAHQAARAAGAPAAPTPTPTSPGGTAPAAGGGAAPTSGHMQNIRDLWNAGMGEGGNWKRFQEEFMKNKWRNAGYVGGGAYGAGVGKDYLDAMTGSDEYDYNIWDKIKMGIGMEKKPGVFDPLMPFFARGYHAN